MGMSGITQGKKWCYQAGDPALRPHHSPAPWTLSGKPCRGGREEPAACPPQEAPSQTQPTGLVGGIPAKRGWLERPVALALCPVCLCLGGVALCCVLGVSQGSAEGCDASRSLPRLCSDGTALARALPCQPVRQDGAAAGGSSQAAARDRHVPWEHLCARGQTLPLPRHPAPGDDRGGERSC